MTTLRAPFAILALVGGPLALAGACSVEGPGGEGGSGIIEPPPPSPTQLCEEQCIPQYPEGEQPYFGIRACILCGACRDSCGGEQNPNCDGVATVADTCSASFPECGSCANEGCAYVQQPDTTVVGPCAVEVNTCVGVLPCVSLFNCVVGCLQGGTTGVGGMGAGGMGAVGGMMGAGGML